MRSFETAPPTGQIYIKIIFFYLELNSLAIKLVMIDLEWHTKSNITQFFYVGHVGRL